MPDYRYYLEDYAGSSISEGQFPELMARARDWLENLERYCTVKPYGPDSRKLALCAVAEALQAWRRVQNCQQLSIGGVSVRYEPGSLSMQRKLLQAAAGYLEICRGVG